MTLYVCWFVTYFSVIVRANNQIESLYVSNEKEIKISGKIHSKFKPKFQRISQ